MCIWIKITAFIAANVSNPHNPRIRILISYYSGLIQLNFKASERQEEEWANAGADLRLFATAWKDFKEAEQQSLKAYRFHEKPSQL